MRIYLAIFFFLNFNFAFSQAHYSVHGYVFCSDTNVTIPYCTVKIISSDGYAKEIVSDSLGFYRFENLNDSVLYELSAHKQLLYQSSQRLHFQHSSNPDTTINFHLTPMVVDYLYFPTFYFKKNSTQLINKSQLDSLSLLTDILIENPTLRIRICGHKDNSESKDYRLKRADFVQKKLLQAGIAKDRMTIEVSDLPNELYNGKIDCRSGERETFFLTEKYISSFSPDKQIKTRQLNSCVTFQFVSM